MVTWQSANHTLNTGSAALLLGPSGRPSHSAFRRRSRPTCWAFQAASNRTSIILIGWNLGIIHHSARLRSRFLARLFLVLWLYSNKISYRFNVYFTVLFSLLHYSFTALEISAKKAIHPVTKPAVTILQIIPGPPCLTLIDSVSQLDKQKST